MTFEEIVKIKLMNLSAGQKKAALYLTEHKKEISYDTLAKLSHKIGVSETTIIRLAFSLGFDSFCNMQRKIQEEVLGAAAYTPDKPMPGIYHSIINNEIAGLKELTQNLEEDKLELAAEHLWHAEQVFVVGERGALGVIIWFSDVLGHLRNNVYMIKANTEEGLGKILDITENTVILCVSMSRYSKASIWAVQEAKKKGARIILLTDSPLSPAALVADDLFVVKTFKNETGFNSFIAAFCVENMLIAAIRKNHAKESAQRIKNYEELYRQKDVFYE